MTPEQKKIDDRYASDHARNVGNYASALRDQSSKRFRWMPIFVLVILIPSIIFALLVIVHDKRRKKLPVLINWNCPAGWHHIPETQLVVDHRGDTLFVEQRITVGHSYRQASSEEINSIKPKRTIITHGFHGW